MQRWLRVIVPVVISLAACTATRAAAPAETASAPPNILLIVLDDMGYNDLGANGNPEAPTPNLDALAAEGVRYTRHYADATCSVARAALMTGTFPAAHGLRPNHLGLSVGTPTIASMLKARGYRTQHIGKWHIASATMEQAPTQYGFDNWYGFLHNNELNGPAPDGIHYRFPTYRKPWLRDNDAPPEPQPGHLTDLLTERAISFLDQQQSQSQPWFLNLWYFAPHAPIQPDPRFRKKYPDTKEGKYHALIDQLDFNVGEVMAALDRNGQADNTLVIVLSDNGGTNKMTDNNRPFVGAKSLFTEGGQRTPMFMRWPGHIEPDRVSDELVSIYDIFPTIAQASDATPPDGLIGRSLLDPQRAEFPELYWEYSNSENHQYSVLSADGRWRLFTLYDAVGLIDLEADPTGRQDVKSQYPEVAARLTSNYLRWRKATRLVSVDYQSLNARGGAVLRGDDLQRSPGYAGFTLAIGVTPPTTSGTAPAVIAEQAERWRLQTTSSGGLRLEVLGQTMEAPALTAGQCNEVVVSTQFNISPVRPSSNKSLMDLYVNGVRVAERTRKNPALNTQGYANPTYIGMNPLGEEQFQGQLSQPLIINERIVPDDQGAMIGNGISGVPPTCPHG
ncbi:MAG: sulfatase-like hydrolase/transferase [Halioglobus sp.]|nr:sulfatase-like hydrolase/transferase [Halioglobus sp.]